MQDATKVSLPSKGKGREDQHWQVGWWDLSLSAERPRSPFVWSKSSVIYTAHPSQPWVVARHFPSSRQWIVPSPSIIETSPSNYEPPSLISISPTDDWLFAYFPGRGGAGVGCLWRRGAQVDDWIARDEWQISAGAGPVAAEWTCGRREWVMTDSHSLLRLPPKGPSPPSGCPILYLVTQNHQLHVVCVPPTFSHFKIVRASLVQAAVLVDSHPTVSDAPQAGPGGVSTCVSAAIGPGYNGRCMMIAMRSQLLPPATQVHPQFLGFDLSIGIAENGLAFDTFPSTDGELWGEQLEIQLCEVVLDFRVGNLYISTRPMAPITSIPAHVTDLIFVHRSKTGPHSTTEDKALPDDADVYLAVSTVDFGDYSIMPRSELRLYSFSPSEPEAKVSIKRSHLESHRVFEDSVLNFTIPFVPDDTVLAGLFETNEAAFRKTSQARQSRIGRIAALTVPELSETAHCPMVVNADEVGRDAPINVAISPNYTILCALRSPSQINSHFSVHAVPNRHLSDMEDDKVATLSAAHHEQITASLVAAIRSRNSPADVVHALCLPAVSIDMVASILYGAITAFKRESLGLSNVWLHDIFGVATEVYREKAKQVQDESMKSQLESQWKLARDLGGLRAYCDAFEECQEEESYDLDAVWQLLALGTWLTELVENLLRECVLIGDDMPAHVKKEPGSEDTSPDGELNKAIFLLVVHPYCLYRFSTALAHMRRFRDQVTSQSAKGESAHMAKDILLDIRDQAGFDLDKLIKVVSELLQEAEAETKDRIVELDTCMARCCPTPAAAPLVRKNIEKVLSSDVIDRSRLFLKPGDLIDGIANISISEGHPKEKEKDVVTKSVLPRHGMVTLCLRCGGRSEASSRQPLLGEPSAQWLTWKKSWKAVCICGGTWINTSLP